MRGATPFDRGFTLLELLVSVALTLVLMITLYSMLDVNQKVLQNQQDLVSMQQNGRAAMEYLSHDLIAAGYNLVNAYVYDASGNKTLLDETGVIFPNADMSNTHSTDAVSIVTRPDPTDAAVIQDMVSASSVVVVDSLDGFQTGDQVLILGKGADGLQHYDFFKITQLETAVGGEKRIHHSPPDNPAGFSTSYLTGAVATTVEIVSYYLADDASGVKELVKRPAGATPVAVASRVVALGFRYFGEDNPTVELADIDTAAERKRIKKIEITLAVEAERTPSRTGPKRSITWQSDVSPRNLVLRQGG